MVTRAFRLDSELPGNIERTPQGGAIIPAMLTRSGVVSYVQPDGSTVREWRPWEEVSAPESLATLDGAPVCLEHPGLVTNSNFREHTRGHVVNGSVGPQEPFASGKLWIQDAELLDDVASNRRVELSPGYNCSVEKSSGVTPDGEPYDAIQRKIRYNHVAVTRKGKQGPEVSLRLDSEGNLASQSSGANAPERQFQTMKTVMIGGVAYIVGGTEADNAALLAALAREATRFDSLASERATREAELKSQALAATARAEAAEKNLQAALRYDATDTEVLAKAASILGADYKAEGKTSGEVMRDCVAKAYPELSMEGKSEDYVSGLFDAIEVETGEDVPSMDGAPPAATDDSKEPPARMDSHPSVARVNLASALPGKPPAPARPELSATEQLRQDSLARGRAPLRGN